MNQNQVVETLQEKAKTNKALNAVAHDWALRKRARNIVTIQALKQRMNSDRLSFSDKEYAEVLEICARLGFGTIELDSRGRVRALKDVKTKLQSIGRAALGEKTTLLGYRRRNRFSSLDHKVPEPKAAEVRTNLTSLSTVLSITLDVKGKPVVMTLPSDLTNEEIAEFISRLK